jgi:hypothetical protein
MSQVTGASGKLIDSRSPTAVPDPAARLVHQPVIPSVVVNAAYAAVAPTPSIWTR